jgi:hypothetical protein
MKKEKQTFRQTEYTIYYFLSRATTKSPSSSKNLDLNLGFTQDR